MKNQNKSKKKLAHIARKMLMVLLILLGAVLFVLFLPLILLLSLFPVTVYAAYREKAEVQIQYLFFKIKAYPPKAKKPKKQKAKAQKPATPQKPTKPKEAPDIKELWELMKSIWISAQKPLKKILRGILIEDLLLELVIAQEDAAQTAIRYGQVNVLLYTGFAFLQNIFRFRNVHFDVRMDFLSEEQTIAASGKIRAFPITVEVAAVWFGASFLRLQFKKMMQKPQKEPPAPASKEEEQNHSAAEKPVGSK